MRNVCLQVQRQLHHARRFEPHPWRSARRCRTTSTHTGAQAHTLADRQADTGNQADRHKQTLTLCIQSATNKRTVLKAATDRTEKEKEKARVMCGKMHGKINRIFPVSLFVVGISRTSRNEAVSGDSQRLAYRTPLSNVCRCCLQCVHCGTRCFL